MREARERRWGVGGRREVGKDGDRRGDRMEGGDERRGQRGDREYDNMMP